jgi:hypothetical protein
MFVLTGFHSAHLLHNSAGGVPWPLLFVTNYSVNSTLAAVVLGCEFVVGAGIVALAVHRTRVSRRSA